MRKIFTMLAFGLLAAPAVHAQLNIEEAYRKAEANYPLVKRYNLITQTEAYNLQNASRGYLPQLSFSAKATYQTDVTKIPVNVPGIDIPTLNKDQYQAVAELNQVIWDGGVIRAQKEGIEAQTGIDKAQYEVDLYALRERVNDLYFGVLLFDRQLEINTLYEADLLRNFEKVSGYMENGVANEADLDAVRVEQVNVSQQRVELETGRNNYLTMLGILMGENLPEDTRLEIPPFDLGVYGRATALVLPHVSAGYTSVRPEQSFTSSKSGSLSGGYRIDRPELELFDAQTAQLDAQRSSIRSMTHPRFDFFVQGGYGNPGLNMLKDGFTPYAIGGLRFSWNFGNYYTKRNDLAKIDLGVREVEIQRETFLFNLSMQTSQKQQEIGKYRKIAEYDQKMIALRENIRRAAEAKTENGTMSVLDLMRELIAEQNARVTKVVHEIEHLKAYYELNNLINN